MIILYDWIDSNHCGKVFFCSSSPVWRHIFSDASLGNSKKMLILSGISLPLTIIGIFILNYLYYNSRPFVITHFDPIVSHIPDNGFPSDHAALTFLIALIIYKFNRKIGIFLFLISILVSITRIYIGLHHFVDILAGMLLAVVSVILSQAIIKNFILKLTPK